MSVCAILRTQFLLGLACIFALTTTANAAGEEDAKARVERESQLRATVAYGRELRHELIYPALVAGRYETAAEHAENLRLEYAKIPEPNAWLTIVGKQLSDDVDRIRTIDEATQNRIRAAIEELLKAEELLSEDDPSKAILALTKARRILTADLPNSAPLVDVLDNLVGYFEGCEFTSEEAAVINDLCDLRAAVFGKHHFLTLEIELHRSSIKNDQQSTEEADRCASAALAAIKSRFGENSHRCFQVEVRAAFAYVNINSPERAEAVLLEALGKRPSASSKIYSSALVLLAEAQIALTKFADAERTIARVAELNEKKPIAQHMRRRYYQAKADVSRHQNRTEIATIYQEMADKLANEIASRREEFRVAVNQPDAAK